MGVNKIKPLRKLKQKTAQEEIAEQNKHLDEQMTEEGVSPDALNKGATHFTSYIALASGIIAIAFGSSIVVKQCSSGKLASTNKDTQKNLLHTMRETSAPYILTKQDSMDVQNSLHPDSLAQEEGDSLVVKLLVK